MLRCFSNSAKYLAVSLSLCYNEDDRTNDRIMGLISEGETVEFYRESEKDLPVAGEYDVIVAGSGTA